MYYIFGGTETFGKIYEKLEKKLKFWVIFQFLRPRHTGTARRNQDFEKS
jgi:hypothetical protein